MAQFWKSKFFRQGVPFVVFVAAGSVYLKQFATIRYDFRKGKILSKEEAESMGIKLVDVKEKTNEILKEIETADLEHWENIRGPRPWEDSRTYQEEQRKKKQPEGS